jgi:hypothetical protein
MWTDKVRNYHSPGLYSFTAMPQITLHQARLVDNLHDMFQLPMSEVAFHQYIVLNSEIDGLNLSNEDDLWSYIWGNPVFLVRKAYKAITGHIQEHPIFSWLWASKCQPKHKIFFLL